MSKKLKSVVLVSVLVPVLAGLVLALWPTLSLAAEAAQAPCSPDGDFLEKGWLWLYLAAFGNGVLTSLTPCVYPMVPITVAVFGARDQGVTRAKAMGLASSYVLGMGVMYSALGVALTLLGQQFGTFLSNPWVVIPLVVVFVALAASMFGAFDLQLPGSLQAKLNTVGGKGYGGAFGMGLVGGLVAAPCTGPFLALILGPVMATQNLFIGGTTLFVYALGIGVLFFVIAAFALSLPKSGRWMEWIKSFGGVALLVVSVYFLRPLIPALGKLSDPSPTFLYSSIAVAVIGLAVGALHLSFHDDWSVKIRKGLGVALVVVGANGVVNWALTPDRDLRWYHNADEMVALEKATAEGKGVMVDFSAEWCLPCKELEVKTFADGEVYDAIVENFVPLKFDVTDPTEKDEARQEHYGADTLPAVIFVDANGKELARVDKYVPPEDFLATLHLARDRMKTELASLAPCPK